MPEASQETIDQVRRILRDSDIPLTRIEIYATDDTLGDSATVASALNALKRDGEAERDDGGYWHLTNGHAQPATNGTASTTRNSSANKTKRQRRPKRQTIRTGLADRIVEHLMLSGQWQAAAAIADAIGADRQKVHQSLSYLYRHAQRITRRRAPDDGFASQYGLPGWEHQPDTEQHPNSPAGGEDAAPPTASHPDPAAPAGTGTGDLHPDIVAAQADHDADDPEADERLRRFLEAEVEAEETDAKHGEADAATAPQGTEQVTVRAHVATALWSDGHLTIAAPDAGVELTLTPEAARAHIHYLDRMREDA